MNLFAVSCIDKEFSCTCVSHGTSLEPLFVFAFYGVLCGNCN